MANYQDVVSLLNPGVKKGLANLKVKAPLNAKALIMVDIGEQQDPIIIVHVNTKNNNVPLIGFKRQICFQPFVSSTKKNKIPSGNNTPIRALDNTAPAKQA